MGKNFNRRSRDGIERGSVMLMTAVSIFVLVGMFGLAVDLGRVYIVKSEAQAFADTAAISAARHLNGKQTGIDNATAAVTNSPNSWNFDTQTFTTSLRTVEFAKALAGPWSTAPSGSLTGYAYVRVTAKPVLNLSFLPVVGSASTQQVTAQAVAGVVPETFPSGGYLPFSTFAHDATGSNYGYTVGQEYAILWPGNLKKNNACAGDQTNWPAYNFSDNALKGSDRGYFELQSASSISNAILGQSQTDSLAVGDTITLTNGQKQSEQTALEKRASYDTDQTVYSPTPGTAPAYYGNGMRLVVLPVNNATYDANGKVTVVGFASFLLPLTYDNSGNKAWCAIYMGSSTAGGDGTGTPFTGAGAYVVRLVQ